MKTLIRFYFGGCRVFAVITFVLLAFAFTLINCASGVDWDYNQLEESSTKSEESDK